MSLPAIRQVHWPLDAVRDEFDIPIIGVIVPGARAAVEATANGEIGVVGTDATVKSGTYTKVIHQMDPNIHVREKACPAVCPLLWKKDSKNMWSQKRLLNIIWNR